MMIKSVEVLETMKLLEKKEMISYMAKRETMNLKEDQARIYYMVMQVMIL